MFGHFAGPSEDTQGSDELVGGFDGIPRRVKEVGLTAVVRMSRVQQIVDNLSVLDNREMRVSQLHKPVGPLFSHAARLKQWSESGAFTQGGRL